VRNRRNVWLTTTLGAAFAAGLVLASTAFGGSGCGKAGDISFCAQWGVNGFATRLTIKNTGSQTISSFVFTLPAGAGSTGSGVGGNLGCHASSNVVTCTTPIKPGQSQFVDILAGKIAVGSKGSLTMKNGSGAAQPAVSLTLQAVAEGASTEASTTTCEPKLVVEKRIVKLETGNVRFVPGSHDQVFATFPGAKVEYEVKVSNFSNCTAKDVVIDDQLPREFDCSSATSRAFVAKPQAEKCSGTGRYIDAYVGDIPPHGVASLTIYGRFSPLGKLSSYETSNTGFAKADNAAEESSPPVRVDVVRHGRFLTFPE
jgi:uncharacterized repeat protein (TIGR01451 family)